MTIIALYRYNRKDGGVTVSTEKPDVEYTTTNRIIADEGKAVTLDGVDLRTVVDTDNTAGWYEVSIDPSPDSPTPSETELKAQAYDILMGVTK